MELLLQIDVLRWARQRAGLSIEALADKLKAKPEKVKAWEDTGRITMAHAERLADAARIPLGYLYFPEPPKEELPIQDFRTLEGAPVDEPSPELLDVLYDAQRKQDWYRDYLLAEGAEPLGFVGSMEVSGNVRSAAERIRSAMKIKSALAINSTSANQVLRTHVERIEEQGLLVLRSGIVGNNTHRPLDVEEFRGFALSDQYAPLIFINGKDAASAQTFTLMHEVVHVWLGESGVSNPLRSAAQLAGVERFCNGVAAELLVPEAEFRSRWKDVAKLDDPFGPLTKDFKVSLLVILRRAHDLGVLSKARFKEFYTQAEAGFKAMPAKEGSGGNFYATQITRHSRPFVRALAASTIEGKTPYREACNLLGVKMKTFKNLANKALETVKQGG